MHQSKFIYFLKKLSNKELKRFDEFLQSPFHNKSDQILHLFHYVREFHPTYESPKLKLVTVFEHLFPTKPFNAFRIRNIMSKALHLLEQFLIQLTFANDELYQKRLLLKYFFDQKDDKYFDKTREDLSKQLAAIEYRDHDYYYQRHLIEQIRYTYTIIHQNRAVKTNLKEVIDTLDVSYLLARVRYTCSAINSGKVTAAQYKVQELLKLLAGFSDLIETEPLLTIYYRLLKLLSGEGGVEEYDSLKQLLISHNNLMTKHEYEYRQIYAFMLNHQIRQMRVKQGSWDEVLNIYYAMLDKGFLFVNGKYVIPANINNIVHINLLQGYFDEAAAFLDKYIAHIEPSLRDDVYNFNLSKVYFYRKDYRSAIRLTNTFSFLDVFYHVQSKILLLKSYYESDDIDSLDTSEYVTEALSRYVNRSKAISSQNKNLYRRFISFYKKLVKLKYAELLQSKNLTNINVSNMQDKIRGSATAEKSWLLKKVKTFVNE